MRTSARKLLGEDDGLLHEDEIDDSNRLYIFSIIQMENDYKLYCIDALERKWIVDKTQAATLETLKYEFGTVFRTVNPILRQDISKKADDDLFSFETEGEIPIQDTQWCEIIRAQTMGTTIRMRRLPGQTNLGDIFEENANMRVYDDCVEGRDAHGPQKFVEFVEFVDPLGRQHWLSTTLCIKQPNVRKYTEIALRAVKPLRKQITKRQFAFIRENGLPMARDVWKITEGMTLLMMMEEPPEGKRRQERFSYPGRSDILWDGDASCTTPNMYPALKAVPK